LSTIYSLCNCYSLTFPDISSSFYTITTVLFTPFVCNTSVAMLNITLFNNVEKVSIKISLSIEVVVVLMINLASISSVIVNSEFIVAISF
jgi:hypothetical protein